jgi:hypothetical protein
VRIRGGSFEIAVGKQLRRSRLESFLRIEHERQHFVLHVDQLQRFVSGFRIDRGQCRDRLAFESDAVV